MSSKKSKGTSIHSAIWYADAYFSFTGYADAKTNLGLIATEALFAEHGAALLRHRRRHGSFAGFTAEGIPEGFVEDLDGAERIRNRNIRLHDVDGRKGEVFSDENPFVGMINLGNGNYQKGKGK